MNIIKFAIIGMVLLYGSNGTANPSTHELVKIFDHTKHKSVLDEQNILCVSCHPMGKKLSLEEEKKVTTDRNKSCHKCHKGSESLVAAPKRCTLCHNVTPADKRHMFSSWKTNHGIAAKFNQSDCEQCHTPKTCSTCHSGQGRLERNTHSRGFINSHSIKARMNSHSCSSCHQASFCADCHNGAKL